MYITTYNIRTLNTEEHLNELDEELSRIKWDMLVICETRLYGETTLRIDHVLFQKNFDNNLKNTGVEILINKILCYFGKSYIVIKFNKRYSLQIIQLYIQTNRAGHEEGGRWSKIRKTGKLSLSTISKTSIRKLVITLQMSKTEIFGYLDW